VLIQGDVDQTVDVRWLLNAGFEQDGHSLSAQLSEKEAELKNDVLATPRLGSLTSANTALIVAGEQYDRECGTGRMILELFKDGAAAVGLLMQNDDISTGSAFKDSHRFVKDRPCVAVHHENRTTVLALY
jgi:hypothetical protein